MTSDVDLLRALLADVEKTAPQFAQAWRALEIKWRVTYGGERFYIPKRPADVKCAVINSALESGIATNRALKRAHVRPSWGYELLHRAGAKR